MSDAQPPVDDDDADAEYEEWSRVLDELDARAVAAENSDDPAEVAEVHLALAEHVNGIAEPAVMIDLLLTARTAYEQFDPVSAMRCAISVADVAQAHGNFDTARDAFRVVCEESAALEDRTIFVESLNNFGCMAMQTGDFADADDAFRLAIDIYRQLGSEHDVAEVRINRANNYRLSGRLDEAESELVELREMFDEGSTLAATCADSLAAVYMATNRPREGLDAFEEVVRICDEMGDEEHALTARMGMAQALIESGELNHGTALLESVRDRFADLGRPDRVAMCEYNRANALAAKDAFAEADEAFGVAAQGLADAGLHHQVGNLQWNRVKRLMREAAATPARGNALSAEAVDAAVSSLIAADYERFQFSDARRRADWKATLEHRITWTFLMAHKFGSKELAADLIETVLNAGVYGMTGSEDDPDDLAPLDVSPAGRIPAEVVTGTSATAWTLGAATLLASAELPMAPPPALVDGEGRVLLARHREMAAALDPDLAAILRAVPRVRIW